jgi:hypothetical protein
MATRAPAVHDLELIRQRPGEAQAEHKPEPRQSEDVTLRTSDRMLLSVEQATERLAIGRQRCHDSPRCPPNRIRSAGQAHPSSL